MNHYTKIFLQKVKRNRVFMIQLMTVRVMGRGLGNPICILSPTSLRFFQPTLPSTLIINVIIVPRFTAKMRGGNIHSRRSAVVHLGYNNRPQSCCPRDVMLDKNELIQAPSIQVKPMINDAPNEASFRLAETVVLINGFHLLKLG